MSKLFAGRLPWAAILLVSLLGGGLRSQGTVIGFAEDFALADDRARAIERLVPGSPEHWFHSCLHLQNEGRLEEVGPMLAAWIAQHGRSAEVAEIENRQALLGYATSPAATLAFLRQRLGLRFDHARATPGAAADLPSRLDPELLTHRAWTDRAFRAHPGTLDGFNDRALEQLASSRLDDRLLEQLLARLRRPDVPNLAALVVRGLQLRRSGFGTLEIHQRLLLDQLDACAREIPSLLGDERFVATYAARLRPSEDVAWQHHADARERYLERLESFAARLPAAQNSFVAHVRYRRLAHDLELGRPDRERFLAYLRLPRALGYVAPRLRQSPSQELARLDAEFATGFPPIRDDQTLVRAYFEHFLVDAEDPDAFAGLVDARWLRRVFAETKILAGVGDMQRWYAMLDDPAYYQALRDRVEIRFAPASRRDFAVGETVRLEVDVKNVETLILKVFEIDAFAYLQATGREPDESIELDGLVATHEQTLRYEEPPLRRVRRSLELPAIDRPGTWVVDLIGNGLASRAVIRMGRLQMLERPGAAGHLIRVLDERGRHLPEATAWFGGRELRPDAQGAIVVPYSTEPGSKPIVLRHGELASRAVLEHRAESYRLDAAVHVEREALLSGRTAKLLVRPTLTLAGRPIDLGFLDRPRLDVTAVDEEGMPSTLDIGALALSGEREIVQELRVPAGLRELRVSLHGRVRSLTSGEIVELASTPVAFALNGIDATVATSCPLLTRTPDGYVVELRGKNGEPKPGRAISIAMQHRDYVDAFHTTLKTDARGRIELGMLDDVTTVTAAGFGNEMRSWTLRDARRTWPRQMHGVAGRTLRLPYVGDRTGADASGFSLLELRGGAFVRDLRDRLALADGHLELRDLPAGDFDLWLKDENVRIAVRTTAGEPQERLAIGRDRVLELPAGEPMHLLPLAIDGDLLRIELRGATPSTRVHVFATRYLPAFDPFADLRTGVGSPLDRLALASSETTYRSERQIGDEYRYVLDRRFAPRFPGNMLQRPGLLLNPFALAATETAIALEGAEGGAFGRRGGGRRAEAEREAAEPPAPVQSASAFPNLDFLPAPAQVHANLSPDEAGLVTVPLAELGAGHVLHVVALDGSDVTAYRRLTLPERELVPSPRQLENPLDPELHLTQHQAIELVAAGAAAVIEDTTTAERQTYGSLADVFHLFRALTRNEDLSRFEFVLRWPSLTAEEKRATYSAHACHELHLFLQQKDREFFDAVVRPYLENKLHPTFLDDWLLDRDLGRYLRPWAFARLNAAERALLARRLPERAAEIARDLGDRVAVQPPDPERVRRLFATALAGEALAADTALEKKALGLMLEDQVARRRAPGPAGPATAAPAAPRPAEDAAEPDRAGRSEFFLGAGERADLQRERREEVRPLYRAPEPTRRWVEQHYWKLPLAAQDADLIAPNAFWHELAATPSNAPFVSTQVADASGSFAEMMLALAVLDLPFAAAEPAIEEDGQRLTLRSERTMLLVRQEIRPAQPPATSAAPVLVSQNLYRLDERYRQDGDRPVDAFLDQELLVDVAYGCQVVVTNPTSGTRRLDLLLQIPAGAIPLRDGFRTRGLAIELGGYSTQAIDYAFYFPAPGRATHYPVHVAEKGALVGFAEPRTWEVLLEPRTVDTASWEHVSQNGTTEQVLAFLESANLHRTDLSKIAWRMRDAAVQRATIDLLRRRLHYEHLLWSYGLLHGDADVIREYLPHATDFVAACGRYLDSPLLTIDPVERRSYEHVEFTPLFNARAHRFAGERRMLNDAAAAQYLALLDVLRYRPRLDDLDRLSVTYYLLLQDRIGEALAQFSRVAPAQVPGAQLQYDYMRAYLDFFSERPAVAREIAAAYLDHPVERWRRMFREVVDQLDEAEGRAVARRDRDGGSGRQDALAATEPAIDLSVENRQVHLSWRNLTRCEVNYYVVDVEFSFSSQPFAAQGSGGLVYVRPNRSDEIELASDRSELAFELPSEFHNSNVIVEVRAGGTWRRQAYYANSLRVHWSESYGQLEVSDAGDGRPLPKVYVKVFARGPGGAVRFHKDGYTDLRGRFDYASVSGAPSAERFAILVLSEDRGATIREVEPPRS